MAARLDDGDDDGAELHEINVTPFIDVMLVLLIIFMVAAPLSTVDVAVDLPVSTAKPQPRPEQAAVPDDQGGPVAGARQRSHSRCGSSPRHSMPRLERTARSASSCAPTSRFPTAS